MEAWGVVSSKHGSLLWDYSEQSVMLALLRLPALQAPWGREENQRVEEPGGWRGWKGRARIDELLKRNFHNRWKGEKVKCWWKGEKKNILKRFRRDDWMWKEHYIGFCVSLTKRHLPVCLSSRSYNSEWNIIAQYENFIYWFVIVNIVFNLNFNWSS